MSGRQRESASTVSIEPAIATPATKGIPAHKAVEEFLQPASGRSIDISCAGTVRHGVCVSVMLPISYVNAGEKRLETLQNYLLCRTWVTHPPMNARGHSPSSHGRSAAKACLFPGF